MKVLMCIFLVGVFEFIGVVEGLAQIQGLAPATLQVGVSGATGITWYKDNVVISGATSGSYSATANGVYYAKYTDPGTNQNCKTVSITLTTAPTSDLGVSITPLTQTANAGNLQQYVVTVVNNGPSSAPNAIVEVPIPTYT